MSARPIDVVAETAHGAAQAAAPRRWRIAGTLAPWQFVGIVFAFWTYVTVSAVLYAYSMGSTLAAFTTEPVFASWHARVVQHALLFPVLLGCYTLSLRLEWKPLWRTLPVQLFLGVGFAMLAKPAMHWAFMILVGNKPGETEWDAATKLGYWFNEKALTQGLASFTDLLLKYGFGLALLTGFVLYKRYRDTESRFATLERQWASARLAALRMQLSPHTLFNLLHTIRGNIAWDPPTAQAMVVQLADLLRRLLAAGEREWSRLADEMQFVQLYLELQQKRFSDRLTIELPPASTLPEVWVPSLILQPLVENAVVHGLAGHDGPVTIRVTVTKGENAGSGDGEAAGAGGSIVLEVVNDTARGRATGREGIGLRNVRERLAVQLGRRAGLRAGPDGNEVGADAARWRSAIRLPALRELPATRRDAD